ncbi:serine hydrolase domain-containing protein [Bacillus sp. AK031]
MVRMKAQQLSELISIEMKNEKFSGAVLVKRKDENILEESAGFADKAEERLIHLHTRFGIASGCKIFTAIAICQLVGKGIITFETKLKDCLDIEFKAWDEDITIHHLMTHSAGIPDYFDEETMSDFADLWKETPMYLLHKPKDFLPMFQDQKMKFKPGEKFHYNNAGYIVLGLIVEQQSGLSFTEYINENIFGKAGMYDSGYFSMDSLPKNTAYGYVEKADGSYKTNLYSVPIKGGPDGGAFITAPDMVEFWKALFNHQLVSKEITQILLAPHVRVKEGVDYGYGIWMNSSGPFRKYHVMGYDPGVSFHSGCYPEAEVTFAVVSNHGKGAFAIMKKIEESLFSMK